MAVKTKNEITSFPTILSLRKRSKRLLSASYRQGQRMCKRLSVISAYINEHKQKLHLPVYHYHILKFQVMSAA